MQYNTMQKNLTRTMSVSWQNRRRAHGGLKAAAN